MARNTKEMCTSSQTIMNLTDKILEIEYFPERVEGFYGIKTDLPKGYQPKIKIVVKKIDVPAPPTK